MGCLQKQLTKHDLPLNSGVGIKPALLFLLKGYDMGKKKDRERLLKILKKYGWAPGVYAGKCGGCGRTHFDSDRRAIICFECACKTVLGTEG